MLSKLFFNSTFFSRNFHEKIKSGAKFGEINLFFQSQNLKLFFDHFLFFHKNFKKKSSNYLKSFIKKQLRKDANFQKNKILI